MFLFNFNSGFEIFNFLSDEKMMKRMKENKIKKIFASPFPNIVTIVCTNGAVCGFNIQTADFLF